MFCSLTNRKVKTFAHFGCNIAQLHQYCLESIYELQFSSITTYSKLDFLWTLSGPLKLMKMPSLIPNQVIRKASPQHDTAIPGVCRVMITVSFSYTVCSMEAKKVSLVLVWSHHILPRLMRHGPCGKLQTRAYGFISTVTFFLPDLWRLQLEDLSTNSPTQTVNLCSPSRMTVGLLAVYSN